MNLTNGEIFDASQPLNQLMKKELPVKISYKLAKMASKLNEQLKIIEEVRVGLVRKYGDKNNPQKKLEVSPNSENWDKFESEVNELMEQEVELVMDKIMLPKEIDGKPLLVEASILMPLQKLLEVE